MRTKKGKRLITLLLACVMVFTPVASQAKNDLEAVLWTYDDDTGKRTGLASAIIDGVTYYDLYEGASTDSGKRTSLSSQISFLQDVLTTEYEGGDLLDYWSDLAYAIYASRWEYAHLEENNTWLSNPQSYIRTYLKNRTARTTGSPSTKNQYIITGSGLQYATSMSAVRNRVIDIMATDTATYSPYFTNSSNGLTSDTYKNAFSKNGILSELDDSTTDDVFYSIVNFTDYENPKGDDDYINSNVWGIAFYDFQLQIIANDELSYITAAEGYNDLESAAEDGVAGVTYTTTGNDNENMNYYQNRTTSEAEVGMEFTQSTSMTVSNSMEETSTYTYSEMLGSETKVGSSILGLVSLEETFTADFTTEEALSTAYSEETSRTQETSSTTSTSMNLPAQTAVSIASSTGTTTASIDYDCPVAVSYKVCVFSCSTQIADTKHNKDKNQQYAFTTYSSLVTKFGTDTAIGGMDARENLYNRAIVYPDLESYDRSYGSVSCIKRGGAMTTDYLPWKDILNGTINPEDLDSSKVPIYVNICEVGMDGDTATAGDRIARYTYDQSGYLGYQTKVEAENTYVITDEEDDGTVTNTYYDLYLGPVYDANGNDLNADLSESETTEGLYTKEATPMPDEDCTVTFYYVLSEDQHETESGSDVPAPASLSAPVAEESADTALSEETAAEEPVVTEEAAVETEPETVPETVVEVEETAEPETAAVEETAAEPEEAAAEEAVVDLEEVPAEPAEAAEEVIEEPEESVEPIEEPEEIVEIAEYAAAPEAEEIIEEQAPVEPEAAEIYEASAESDEDAIIVEDGDLIGSISNGGTVAGIDSNGSYEPSLTIESIEVIDSADIPEELQDGEDSKAEEQQEPQEVAQDNAAAEIATASSVMPLATIGFDINSEVVWIVKHMPLSVTGATLNIVGQSTTSEMYDMMAIYPLDYTSVTSDQKIFEMITGTTMNVDNIAVGGFNKNNVEYFGFDQDKGYWVLVDEDGNELEDGDSEVASLSTNANTGVTLLSADGEGTVYLKYKIDEDSDYTYMNGDDDPATNELMSSAATVQINVANGPFYGDVYADGTLTGYANETDDDYERVYINLDTCDTISATVYDETDKKVSNPAITWEAQENEEDGIILEDDQLYFTEPGTYHIRAIYGYSTINNNPYSDWIEITALPEKVLDELTIEDVTDPATLSDIILGDGNETINLGWLDVSGIDQYELDWTKFDKLKWYVDGEEVEPDVNGSYLYTATEAGDHVIYAECAYDGKYDVKSNELTLTVNAERELSSLEISDTAGTLEEFIYGDGKESVDLAELTIVHLDQYGDEWEDLTGLTWYVDGEALDGSVYMVTEGTHTIYAECADDEDKYDVKSNELTLSVLPARKLNSLQISDTTSPKTLAEVTYGEGKENVDLSKLKLTALDQYGDEWTDLGSLKWYVDGQALSGSVYTVKNTSAGTHSIYAQCDGVKTNTLSISVKVPATSVKLNKDTLEIKDGKTKQLKATMAPSGTTDTVTWTSSNKKVATVSEDGTVTAVSAGTATITAKTTSGQTATCQVHAVYKKNETFTKGSYKYVVKDSSTDGTGEVTMNGFAKGKSRKKLTVPDTVTVNGTTYKVTAIANGAFKGNSTIKTFTTGSNLTTIGTSAFEDCQSLKTVTIGNSVKKINFKAFYDCYNLKTLSIGKNVNYMGAHCFCNDSKLKTITIKTTKLKKKNVESPHVFINVNKATMKVPKSKYKDYKKLFTAREYGGTITKK